MRPVRAVIGRLPRVLLTACVASQTAQHSAVDRPLTTGDIQVAEAHVHAFGFDPGPIDGIFTAETRAAVQAYQARYGLPVSGRLDRETRRELLPGLGYDRMGR